KVWLIVMIFLRILILLFAGYPLYQDEQERFVCNTIQPGCANVCYDFFSPISLFRFWLVQLVTLCFSYIIFIIYVVHTLSNALTVDLNSCGHIKDMSLFKIHQEPYSKMSENKMPVVAERGWAPCFTGAYILHLLLRTLLETGFGAAQYYLFGFYIPRRFLCQHPPCTTQVDCYISRPTEKTVMLNFMLGTAALSLFLNVLDFICAIKRSMRQKSKRNMMMEKIYEAEQCFLSTTEGSRELDLNTRVAQRDIQGEASQSGSFRKRQGSSGSCAGVVLTLGHESPLPCPQEPSGCNTNGNNDYSVSQEGTPERSGSKVALCPPEPLGTSKPICVGKRSRLKPPPPLRQDLRLSPGRSPTPTATTICTRRVDQYMLVELGSGSELQTNSDGQEKRSAWV
uniref:Gap junction protein n=2 Tax=Monopterus albus TaxID=43700 RepID=A0A3Q3KB13_MONAL